MSDKTLDKLIAQLKSEAIDAAEKEAQRIIEEAKAKAKNIIKNAEVESQQLLLESKKEAKNTISKGESALKQSARDLKVAVKNDLLKLFEAVFEREVKQSFTPDLIKTAVLLVIDNIGNDIELKLPEDVEQELLDAIYEQLQVSDYSKSILKEKNLLKGFSITKTDQGWSYEITPQEIANILNEYLSQNWINILDN
jgi:F0F1-type ATP synthase membrane subunit b/b'